jgi:flavin-dependent thymidylate synthase
MRKIVLAGFNVDKSLIDQLPNQKLATPEVISAAYARISRSKKDVTSLRKEAISEIDKARESNNMILYEMGHSSIAEHSVFNFDLIGVSRYVTEFIQRSRLASFTEKSQRYVTLKGDYVIPPELRGHALDKEFHEVIALQNSLYNKYYEAAKSKLEQEDFPGGKRDLQSRAKEDARYFLSLATETQMGMTINARNLEKLLRRLDKTGLTEAQEIRKDILAQVEDIAPSIIKYTKADRYERKVLGINSHTSPDLKDIDLLYADEHGDEKILTSVLYESSGMSWNRLYDIVMRMSEEEKSDWFTKIFADMKSFHSVHRGFENAGAGFEALISSSCFAQLKRHRMSTILHSDYNPSYGFVLPPLLVDLIDPDELDHFQNRVAGLYHQLKEIHPLLGNYILTNGHKLRVTISFSMREFYHFARLRSDQHAQWEIRDLSDKLICELQKLFPLASGMLSGKHEFKEPIG